MKRSCYKNRDLYQLKKLESLVNAECSKSLSGKRIKCFWLKLTEPKILFLPEPDNALFYSTAYVNSTVMDYV